VTAQSVKLGMYCLLCIKGHSGMARPLFIQSKVVKQQLLYLFYLARKPSQNKENKMARVTCTDVHRVVLVTNYIDKLVQMTTGTIMAISVIHQDRVSHVAVNVAVETVFD